MTWDRDKIVKHGSNLCRRLSWCWVIESLSRGLDRNLFMLARSSSFKSSCSVHTMQLAASARTRAPTKLHYSLELLFLKRWFRLFSVLIKNLFSRFRYPRHSRRHSSLATSANRWLQLQSDPKASGRLLSAEESDNIRIKWHVTDVIAGWFRMVSCYLILADN